MTVRHSWHIYISAFVLQSCVYVGGPWHRQWSQQGCRYTSGLVVFSARMRRQSATISWAERLRLVCALAPRHNR